MHPFSPRYSITSSIVICIVFIICLNLQCTVQCIALVLHTVEHTYKRIQMCLASVFRVVFLYIFTLQTLRLQPFCCLFACSFPVITRSWTMTMMRLWLEQAAPVSEPHSVWQTRDSRPLASRSFSQRGPTP